MIQANQIKKYAKAFFTPIGIILVSIAIIMALITNFNFGIVFTLLLGIMLLVYGVKFEEINKLTETGFFKWVRRFIFVMLALVVCLIIYLAVYGRIDTVTYREDAVIVLGAGIRGEEVTMPLAYRLLKAVEYFEKNPRVVIVVSGGQGVQEHITEALAMERYLIERGVPGDKIIKEERSTSTYENFVFSKEILDEYFQGQYSVAFITNHFHIYRASKISEIVGLRSTWLSAKMQWYAYPVNYLRECVAIMKLWAFNR